MCVQFREGQVVALLSRPVACIFRSTYVHVLTMADKIETDTPNGSERRRVTDSFQQPGPTLNINSLNNPRTQVQTRGCSGVLRIFRPDRKIRPTHPHTLTPADEPCSPLTLLLLNFLVFARGSSAPTLLPSITARRSLLLTDSTACSWGRLGNRRDSKPNKCECS